MKKCIDGIEIELTEQEIAEIKSVEITAEEKIYQLKQKLALTDYKAIKYAEGFISKEDYAPIKSERQLWRDEINQLEKSL